jgi:hypothetical protein
MLRNDVHLAAQAIALQKNHRVLVLTGKLDGPNGLPKSVSQHGKGVQLRMMGEYTRYIPTAIFEILDEDALCAIIDQLQINGGYKAIVLGPDGRSDPSYAL